MMEELYDIMAQGNTRLKECAKMMDMTHREFRGKLFNNKLDTSKLTQEQLDKLNAAKPFIFAVKDQCETKIRKQFKRLIHKYAHSAARKKTDSQNIIEDFVQEGEIALLDAIYGYTDVAKASFLTYASWAVLRKILDCANRLNPFCPLTQEAQLIIRKVTEHKRQNPNISEDEVFAALGLDEQEKQIYLRASIKIINEQPLASNVDYLYESPDDYTAFRRGAVKDVKPVMYIRDSVRQALKNADLDEFELDCIFAEMYPYTGWKEDISKKHINKKTGVRYTRKHIPNIIKRAKKKIQNVIMNPPKVQKENQLVDKFFEEWSGVHE